MATRNRRYNIRLQILERKRQEIARKLDQSYLRDSISDFMVLEAKYEETMRHIDKIRSLSKSKRTLSPTS